MAYTVSHSFEICIPYIFIGGYRIFKWVAASHNTFLIRGGGMHPYNDHELPSEFRQKVAFFRKIWWTSRWEGCGFESRWVHMFLFWFSSLASGSPHLVTWPHCARECGSRVVQGVRMRSGRLLVWIPLGTYILILNFQLTSISFNPIGI